MGGPARDWAVLRFLRFFLLHTAFPLTILFHLVECSPRFCNILRRKRNKAASRQAAVEPVYIWDKKYAIKGKWKWCFLFGQILLDRLLASRHALFPVRDNNIYRDRIYS